MAILCLRMVTEHQSTLPPNSARSFPTRLLGRTPLLPFLCAGLRLLPATTPLCMCVF